MDLSRNFQSIQAGFSPTCDELPQFIISLAFEKAIRQLQRMWRGDDAPFNKVK